MAHAASPVPEPASYQAIVERLTEAMRVSKRDLPLARRIINDELAVSDAPSTVIAYWEARALVEEYPHRIDEALRAFIDIIDHPVEDADTHAKALVMALNSAFQLGAVNEIQRADAAAAKFFALYNMPLFHAMCVYTVGRFYMASGQFDSALEKMHALAEVATENGYDGYVRMASAFVGLCYARLGYLDDAKRWADRAEQGDAAGVTCHTTFLRGAIALFDGRTDDARAPLNDAYEMAMSGNERIVAGEILLYRCIAYRDLGNVDAFWSTYQLAMVIAKDGSPYLRDALESVKRGVPNIA